MCKPGKIEVGSVSDAGTMSAFDHRCMTLHLSWVDAKRSAADASSAFVST